jgi:hypothetical protein
MIYPQPEQGKRKTSFKTKEVGASAAYIFRARTCRTVEITKQRRLTLDRNDITVAAEANRQSDSRWRRSHRAFCCTAGTAGTLIERCAPRQLTWPRLRGKAPPGQTIMVLGRDSSTVIADCLPEAAIFAAWANAAATTARPKDSYVWTVAAAYLSFAAADC